MSSDVIKCHTYPCFTACCVLLFLQSQNHAMEEEGLHGPRYAASVAQQSDHRRILCSSEQSKLCPCRTKSLLSDKNQLAGFSWGFFSKVEKSNQGSPDVNMENGTKKLSLAVFFPRKRKQSCHMLTDFSCITWLLTDKIELYRLFHILRKKTPSGCELPFALLTTLPLQNILQWYL